MDFTTRLLKELTEAHGVPGYEGPVRALMRDYLEPFGEVTQDRLGSLICQMPGSSESPRVMLAGHMDEIGFMVTHITQEGFLKFMQLGGWFDQVLLGQRVVLLSRYYSELASRFLVYELSKWQLSLVLYLQCFWFTTFLGLGQESQ